MFRILTERKNVELVKHMLASFCLDYTVHYGDGSWLGQLEQNMTIELNNASLKIAERVARRIKDLNQQQAVLLQQIDATSQLI